ncbi:hypothetical protein [Sphingobacterium paludis]|uniref:Uncharacterized protein n=1 Tax=Sphingobacterium paludis TaxID=1476465 RepID=A0A4R7CSC9_9SPHI|nr:hypothetical protein [Sphingobacterium paludis]TDS07552.1 hypothetical protein B0I21_11340 [Sphingobacterium paludis]
MKLQIILTTIFLLLVLTWNVNTNSIPVLGTLTVLLCVSLLYVVRILRRMQAREGDQAFDKGME